MKGIGVEHPEYHHRTRWWNAHHPDRYIDLVLTWRPDEFGVDGEMVVDLECRRCGSLVATRAGAEVPVSSVVTLFDIHLKECER
jgi:hypothetical protein